jgi:hypothetical protein
LTDILHFLGVTYDIQNDFEKAILYYKESLKYNEKSKSKLQTNIRLTKAYLRSLDFENAYKWAIIGVKDYPEYKSAKYSFYDVCKWSYYIKYHKLNSNYLTNRFLIDEYIVNSIEEEYLILRNIRSKKDRYPVFKSQRTDIKYDYITCSYSREKEKFEIKFKKSWRNNSDFKKPNADIIFDDENEKDYVRIGAMLSTILNKRMLSKSLEKDFPFRFCACSLAKKSKTIEIVKKCNNLSSI